MTGAVASQSGKAGDKPGQAGDVAGPPSDAEGDRGESKGTRSVQGGSRPGQSGGGETADQPGPGGGRSALTQGDGPGEERGGQSGAGTGEGAGTGAAAAAVPGAGAARETVEKLFDESSGAATSSEQATEGRVAPLTTLQRTHSASQELSAVELRLRESVKRIEAERSRRASAATLWRPAVPRQGQSRDW